MSSNLMLAAAFAAGLTGADPVPPRQHSRSEQSLPAPQAAERSARDWRDAVQAALQASSRSAQAKPEQMVPRLVDLYRQLDNAQSLSAVERSRLQANLRTRLLQIEDVLVRRQLRADQESARIAKRSKADSRKQPSDAQQLATVATTGGSQVRSPSAELANGQRPPSGPVGASQTAPGSGPASVYAQLAGGGANPIGTAANGGPSGAGQPANDAGWELVELIRTTVAPETWDVNGGKGSIYYYRPLHALVIRQTGESHHQIGSTLGQLRR